MKLGKVIESILTLDEANVSRWRRSVKNFRRFGALSCLLPDRFRPGSLLVPDGTGASLSCPIIIASIAETVVFGMVFVAAVFGISEPPKGF